MPRLLELLERPTGTLSVLVRIAEPGEHTVTSLVKDLGFSTGLVYSALERLKDLGFITERRDVVRQSLFYSLTAPGEEAAGTVQPLEGLIRKTVLGTERRLEALTTAGEVGSLEGIALLLSIAQTADIQGRWDRAIETAQMAADYADESGDPVSGARAHLLLGDTLRRRGQPRARQHLKTAFRFAVDAERPDLAAQALVGEGALLEAQGEHETVWALYSEAADYASKTNNPQTAALALLGLGRVLARRGQFVEAGDQIQRAISILSRGGSEALGDLTKAYISMGASLAPEGPDKELPWYEKALGISRRAGDVRLMGYALSNMGGTHVRRGDWAEAERALDESQAIFERLGEKRMIASLSLHRGCLEAGRRRWKRAEAAFRRAATDYRALGDKCGLADTLFYSAQMKAAHGMRASAARLYKEARGLFSALGNQPMVEAAHQSLDALSSGTRR